MSRRSGGGDSSAGASDRSCTKATSGDAATGRSGWRRPTREMSCAQEEDVLRMIRSRIWKSRPSHPATTCHTDAAWLRCWTGATSVAADISLEAETSAGRTERGGSNHRAAWSVFPLCGQVTLPERTLSVQKKKTCNSHVLTS